MTGIGRFPRKGDKLDEYYKRLKEVSESKCIINWGLAIFGKPKKDGNSLTYNCQMYNILLVRDTDFSVDPNALDFLCQMGMDMTSVFGTGIRYARRVRALLCDYTFRINALLANSGTESWGLELLSPSTMVSLTSSSSTVTSTLPFLTL